MRDELFLIGRVLFSMLFLGSGIGQLTETEASTRYATEKKVPNPKIMVQLTGVCLVLGGIAVILGIWMDLAGLLMAILVLIFAFKMHRFWEATDEQTKYTEMSLFMKNISIAGGGLIIAAVGAFAPYTMTDGVF